MASKTLTWQHFLEIFMPKIYPMKENLFTIFMETQLSSNRGTFLSKLIQSVQFEYFNGLLPCPLKIVFCTNNDSPRSGVETMVLSVGAFPTPSDWTAS
jgi:hypothetical protein